MNGVEEVCPECAPKGEGKRSREVERCVQSVHGLSQTIKDFVEELAGIRLRYMDPVLAWLVEHASNLLLLLCMAEPHDGHTSLQPGGL